MYQHILIPTDGSELSKIAIHEGVALAKALAGRVTVVTVTTPFHVLSGSPSMVTDTPEQYKEHTAAIAEQYLNVAKNMRPQRGSRATWCTLSMNTHIKRLSKLLRIEGAMRSRWHRMDVAGFQPFWWVAKLSRS